MSILQILATFVLSLCRWHQVNLDTVWLSQQSFTWYRLKSSVFSALSQKNNGGDGRHIMWFTSCESPEICVAWSDITSNHVFTVTLYVILWHLWRSSLLVWTNLKRWVKKSGKSFFIVTSFCLFAVDRIWQSNFERDCGPLYPWILWC